MDSKFNKIIQTIGIILIIALYCGGMFTVWYFNGCVKF